MTYTYEMETRFGTVDYEFIPPYEDVKRAIIDIISEKSPKEIYNILEEIADDGADLEEYFYDELEEYFEEQAKEDYENGKQQEEDYYYDYYHDKL
jgi:hypothetical protein|nr:MAG TPA: hypothetical protein [Caudoviricetes sp.]